MTILDRTRKMLWGRSGSRCAFCRIVMIEPATSDGDASVVGEECHIIAQSPGGPRFEPMAEADINGYNNLILLCRNHHKQVDDQPGTYSVDKLREMKRAHEEWVWQTLNASDQRRRAAELDASELVDSDETGEDSTESLPLGFRSDELFSWRLSDAFPGTRGLCEITDPKLAVDRLDVLFRSPIGQRDSKDSDIGRYSHTLYPFWWFRGPLNMHLRQHERLAEDKCLLDTHELRVSRIAAYRTASSLWNFLYIESAAEGPSGAYTYKEGEISRRLEESVWGYYVSEDYAVWRGRVITNDEYEDSAAMIDGLPEQRKLNFQAQRSLVEERKTA